MNFVKIKIQIYYYIIIPVDYPLGLQLYFQDFPLTFRIWCTNDSYPLWRLSVNADFIEVIINQ